MGFSFLSNQAAKKVVLVFLLAIAVVVLAVGRLWAGMPQYLPAQSLFEKPPDDWNNEDYCSAHLSAKTSEDKTARRSWIRKVVWYLGEAEARDKQVYPCDVTGGVKRSGQVMTKAEIRKEIRQMMHDGHLSAKDLVYRAKRKN